MDKKFTFDANIASELKLFFHRNKRETGRRIAIFDADGTLWRSDIGDAFLDFQVKNGSFTEEQKQHYFEYMELGGSVEEAYAWMASWNAGRSEEQLCQWATECWVDFKRNVFDAQVQLIKLLQHYQFEIWVVSASQWWLVSTAVKELGIDPDKVIATKVKVKDGLLTDTLAYAVPYREGKTKAILRLIGERPLLVSGNSMGDFSMMELSKDLVLAINSEVIGGPYYDTEQELALEVKRRVDDQIASKSDGTQSDIKLVRWLLQKF